MKRFFPTFIFSVILLSIFALPLTAIAAGMSTEEKCLQYCCWQEQSVRQGQNWKPSERCKNNTPPSEPQLGNMSCICNPLWTDSLMEVVRSIQGWLFTTALIVAPLMIIVGAFYVLTSAGEPSRVQKGRSIIIWAAIGLAVILFSKIIYDVIVDLIKAGGGGATT